MSGPEHEHDAKLCKASGLIERVNAATEAIGTSQEEGTSTRLPFEVAVLPLVAHTDLTVDEADCLVSNIANSALEVMIARGGCDIVVLRGLVGQAFLAGVFAGKDAS